MIYRTMTVEDYDQVYALWLSCANMGLNDLDDSREGIGRFLRRNPNTCLVAVEGDSIAGVIPGRARRAAGLYLPHGRLL